MVVNDMSANPYTPAGTRYWRHKRAWTWGLLAVWWVLAFGSTYFARELDAVWMGWPMGFWMAAQGAPLAFLAVVAVYAAVMDRLDTRHDRS